MPFYHLDNEGFRLAIFDESIGRINFDYDRLSSLKFNPLLSEREYNFSLCNDSDYGVPLRSKYPDSEMLFQKQKISRDVQNMMPKIKTYRSIPKKKYVHRVPVY